MMLPAGMMLVRKRGSFDSVVASSTGRPSARLTSHESGQGTGGPVVTLRATPSTSEGGTP